MPTSFVIRALVALPFAVGLLHGQLIKPGATCAGGAVSSALPGGLIDEISRARGIRAGAPWALMRGATDGARARMNGASGRAPVRIAAVLPEILLTTQQSFPMPANDGPMWAGRGRSYSVTGGIAICGKSARWGMIVAPTYWYAENVFFDQPTDPQIVPARRFDYSPWASPYHYLPRSLDAPRRFGDVAISRLEAGSFAVWYRAPRVEVGFTTESEWWGPGVNNALLLSSQSAGAARAYVRTSRPIRAAGELDIRYFLGGLSYSKFHFLEGADSSRTLSGLSLVWRPSVQPGLSVGAARLVAAPILGNGFIRQVLNPLLPTGAPNSPPFFDKNHYPGRDQLFSLFANWRLPEDGAEFWVEWARAEFPLNVRDFLESPNHTQALTLGLQHTRMLGSSQWMARIGAEYSQTNQSPTYRERPQGSWYTSRAVQGGFTQKGQVIGAMIGPGSVTQRLGLDLIGPKHSLGLFAYRIKWDDDSFYTIPRPNGNGLCKHDVSLALGARGTALTPAGWFEATVTTQNRLNIYWQALGLCFQNEELQIDKRNLSLEFRFRPRVWSP